MYSLLWSEHCAYKHSKKLLRTLPTEGPHVVMGPGENAGAVDVGDGMVCAFKVESHNHPSAVEPFQGAATGVGGILRDIFAIGARPIAVLDSLRFGEPDAASARRSPRASPIPSATGVARARYLLDGAVSGIGHYGNSIGVPTVGGEVYFEGPTSRAASSTRWRSGCASASGWCAARRRGRATRSCCSGHPPGATGSGAPRCWPPPSSARPTTPSAPRCRWATPSRRRSCWSARWSCWSGGCSSRCRTSAPPASPPRPRRWRRRARSASTSTWRACRCASPGWSRSRSWCPSPRSGCCAWSRPRTCPRCWRCARSGRSAARRSGQSPTPAACASSTASGWSARCRCGRW